MNADLDVAASLAEVAGFDTAGAGSKPLKRLPIEYLRAQLGIEDGDISMTAILNGFDDRMAAAIAEERLANALMQLPRPGDSPAAFSGSLDGGDPTELEPLGDGVTIQSSASGYVATIIGTGGVADAVFRAVEEGSRVYRVRYAVTRRAGPSDPDGDAVELCIYEYNQTRGQISNRVLNSYSGGTTLDEGDGRQTFEALVTLAAGIDGTTQLNAATRYVRPNVQCYGVDGQTDVELIEWTDITGNPVWSPDVSTFDSRVTALESLDAGDRLTSVEAALSGPLTKIYTTRDGVHAATSPGVSVQLIGTLGYHSAGDGGADWYKRVGSEPAHLAKVQTADNQWWESISRANINTYQAGCYGDGNTTGDGKTIGHDDSAALKGAFEWATKLTILPAQNWASGGCYRYDDDEPPVLSGIHVVGCDERGIINFTGTSTAVVADPTTGDTTYVELTGNSHGLYLGDGVTLEHVWLRAGAADAGAAGAAIQTAITSVDMSGTVPKTGGGTLVNPSYTHGEARRPTIRSCTLERWMSGALLYNAEDVIVESNRILGGKRVAPNFGGTGIAVAIGTNRMVIRGNIITSNIDNGITVNISTESKDAIVEGNIVIPCEFNEVTGFYEEVASADSCCRNGIVSSYYGNTTCTAIVNGNLTRRCSGYGLYMQSGSRPGGKTICTNNFVDSCGFGGNLSIPGNSGSLCGGIGWANGGTDDIIANNVVQDCDVGGILLGPWNGNIGSQAPRVTVIGNRVARINGLGIAHQNTAWNFTIVGNAVSECTSTHIHAGIAPLYVTRTNKADAITPTGYPEGYDNNLSWNYIYLKTPQSVTYNTNPFGADNTGFPLTFDAYWWVRTTGGDTDPNKFSDSGGLVWKPSWTHGGLDGDDNVIVTAATAPAAGEVIVQNNHVFSTQHDVTGISASCGNLGGIDRRVIVKGNSVFGPGRPDPDSDEFADEQGYGILIQGYVEARGNYIYGWKFGVVIGDPPIGREQRAITGDNTIESCYGGYNQEPGDYAGFTMTTNNRFIDISEDAELLGPIYQGIFKGKNFHFAMHGGDFADNTTLTASLPDPSVGFIVGDRVSLDTPIVGRWYEWIAAGSPLAWHNIGGNLV